MQGEYEQDEPRSGGVNEDVIVRLDFGRTDAPTYHTQCDASEPSNNDCDDMKSLRTPLNFPLARRQWIDAAVSVKNSIPEVCLVPSFCTGTDSRLQVRSGVKFGDGDGTIPIVSLGAMCVKGWKGKTKWNPAGIKVVTQGKLD